MSAVKAWARDWLPPIIYRGLQQLRKNEIQFEGDFDNWAEAKQQSTGYDSESILAKVLAATLLVKQGDAAYERDSVTFERIEYAWELLAGLMWTAARHQGRLNVLDFGGALGSSYFQHRQFLDDFPDFHWSIIEQAHYVECGNSHIAGGPLKFFPDIATCLQEQTPNVLMLSSVLQYLQNPAEVLNQLALTEASVILIDRTPIANIPDHRVTVQHVPASIYSASYPMWVFSDALLLKHLETLGWRLHSRYAGPEKEVQLHTGFSFKFEGMVLQKC